jgi:hypothetical protein
MRVVTAVIVLAAAWASTTSAASAQTPRGHVALYGGGAWTSPWMETAGVNFGIGSNPMLGGFGQFWFTPHVGARFHLRYDGSELPEPDNPIVVIGNERMHNWFYDISLAVRPFGQERRRALSSAYLFAGGGGFTPNVEGGHAEGCVPEYVFANGCLPYHWRDATVVQLTAGAGLLVLPITRTLGMFTESAVHAYASPFRMGEEWTGRVPCTNEACNGSRRGGRTLRLVGGLSLALGTPRPMLLLPPPPPPPVPVEEVPVTACVVVDRFPARVGVLARPAVGDTLYLTEQGIRRPLRAAFPSPPFTASGREWFENDTTVFLAGRAYDRYGGPREIAAGVVTRVGEYRGVPLFGFPPDGADEVPELLFIPVQDGCMFQPLRLRERVGGRS